MTDTSTITPEFLRIATDLAAQKGLDAAATTAKIKTYAAHPCAHCEAATWQYIQSTVQQQRNNKFHEEKVNRFVIANCTYNVYVEGLIDCSRSKSPKASQNGWDSISAPNTGPEDRARERPRE